MKKVLLLTLLSMVCDISIAETLYIEPYLVKAAENGDVEAQVYLAKKYYYGSGINKTGKNIELAYKWFIRAAEQGSSESQYFLATDEEMQHIVNSSDRTSEYWLGAAANNGFLLAMDEYGELLFNKGQYSDAIPILVKAAKKGSQNSHYILAVMHVQGLGISKDEELAIKGFEYVTKSFEDISSNKKVWDELKEKTKNYLTFNALRSYEWLAKINSRKYASGINNINRALALAKQFNCKDNLYAELLDTRATIYLLNNENAKCQKDWEQILKLFPNYPSESNTFLSNVMSGNIDYLIPNSETNNYNAIALIIANEKYKRVPNVPFALNDGKVFKNYINKTFGIPDENIEYLEDASLNDIKFAIANVSQRCNAIKDQVSVIVYYAGHGVPDDKTSEAFLLPVDGFGTDPSSGLNLDDFYASLSKMPAKSVVVLLDACFSGAKRDGGMLMATRGITIKPKMHVPDGKLIVFSATSNDETAFPIEQQKHGLFTYTLLRKIQETGGDITWGELADYVTETVKNRSIDLNGKLQSPTVAVSSALKDSWRNFKIR